MSGPTVFISYSHQDETWKDQLVRQLKVLELEGAFDIWEDRQIAAGDGWRAEIETAMARARAAVLLISADFLISDFIRGTEVPHFLQRRAKDGLRIIPVIVRPCAWQAVGWLAEIECRPKDGRALSEGRKAKVEKDLAALALEIRDLLAGSPSTAPQIPLEELERPGERVGRRQAASGRPKFLSAIGKRLLRRWPWTVAVLLLACSGLAWIWWTLHQPVRLYQRGLQAMATLDLPAAQDYLERAVTSGDDLPLERSALAEVLMNLGRDDRAKTEAEHAFGARKNLADNDRLLVEARYWRITGDFPAAIQKYTQLWKATPGEVEYAVALADAQVAQGKYSEALETVKEMKKISEDPRLDLIEANAAYHLGQPMDEAVTRVVSEAERRGLDLLAAEGLLLRGAACYKRGALGEAIEDFSAAEKRSRKKNPEQAARAQSSIASTRRDQGDLQEAEKYYERALYSYRELGDRDSEARQLYHLASIHTGQGKLGQARAEYEKAVERSTDRSPKGAALADLGWLLALQGDLLGAAERLQKAVGIFEETGEQAQRAVYLCKLSMVYSNNLELEPAKSSLANCLESARAVEEPYLADSLYAQGDLFLFQGDLMRASDAHLDALKIYEKLGLNGETAWSQLALAEIQLERKQPAEARSLIEPALKYFSQQRRADDKALAEAVLAHTHLAQGEVRRAQSRIDEAKERVAVSELLDLRVQVALTEAHVLAAMKNVPEARSVIQRELDYLRNRKCPRLTLDARLAQGEIEMIYGDRGRGRELLSRVKDDAEVRGYGLVEDKAARLLAAPAKPGSG